MQQVLDKEKHQQQLEMLKQQNRITEERIDLPERYGAKIKTDLN